MKNPINTIVLAALTLTCTYTQAQTKPEMIQVDGGTFEMGGKEPRDSTAKPIHTVTVGSFSIAKYPITVEEYMVYCNATNTPMPKAPPWGWDDKSPIVNVSYNEALAYCAWLSKTYNDNYMLPTEAEYEFAARGGNSSHNYIFSGGNNLDEVGWYSENSDNQTHPVGQKKPNELGLYDMSGNVFEWCSDWFGMYGINPVTDPKGPATGIHHVLRGGSWLHTVSRSRVARRAGDYPDYRAYTCGFRVVIATDKQANEQVVTTNKK